MRAPFFREENKKSLQSLQLQNKTQKAFPAEAAKVEEEELHCSFFGYVWLGLVGLCGFASWSAAHFGPRPQSVCF